MKARTNKTASIVMKYAHTIKAEFVSFGAALKAAWAWFKNGMKEMIEQSNKITINFDGKKYTGMYKKTGDLTNHPCGTSLDQRDVKIEAVYNDKNQDISTLDALMAGLRNSEVIRAVRICAYVEAYKGVIDIHPQDVEFAKRFAV